MTRGLPDYYRGVDIAYQALAQMIVRPKYGGGLATWGSAVVTANAETTLITVSGKGMIYGGVVFLDHTSSQKTGIARLKADGNLLADMSFEGMNKHNIINPWSYPFYLLKFDEANFVYTVATSFGLTFETNFELAYFEQEGETPTVRFDICYALI